MFALTMGTGMSMAFPDVCETPLAAGAPVPIPYPNVSESATTIPAAYNILCDCMPTVNILSEDAVSEGDEPGVELGVASFLEKRPVGHTRGLGSVD